MKENMTDNNNDIKNGIKTTNITEKKEEIADNQLQKEELKENDIKKNINDDDKSDNKNEIKNEPKTNNNEDTIIQQTATKIHSSIITTGKEKINDIYLKKVKDLSKIYSYTANYLLFLSQLFKKLNEPFYSKLSSSYINNIKPYLKYFKDLITILTTFSEKINQLNLSINPELYSNDEESIIRSENNLNLSVKKINTSLGEVYNKIALDLKIVTNKPIFLKYENIEIKFEENFHKMLALISNLEQLRIKYNSEFSKRYVNIFNTFVDKYNELDNYLINMKNFFSIEYDIVVTANYVMKKVEEFILQMKALYEESINIFCDYLEMLKIMIKIYYQENKKIILPKILPEKMILDLEKLSNQNIRKNLEKKFCIKNIIEHYHDENLRNEINHLLLKYQEIFSKFNLVQNDIIKDISKFNLQYFKTNEIFFNFLKILIPPKYEFNFGEGIQFKTGVKRDCGLFKGWKECQLVISYQGHILFFDEDENNPKTNTITEDDQPRAQSMIINRVNIKTSPDLEDINKIKNEIEINNKEEAKYGIVPEKLSLMYYKNNYGIRKKNIKQGKYFFEIWEKGLGNKKNKINIIDALNTKNLENILLELTETNIYDD